jgi:hypothetical protein
MKRNNTTWVEPSRAELDRTSTCLVVAGPFFAVIAGVHPFINRSSTAIPDDARVLPHLETIGCPSYRIGQKVLPSIDLSALRNRIEIEMLRNSLYRCSGYSYGMVEWNVFTTSKPFVPVDRLDTMRYLRRMRYHSFLPSSFSRNGIRMPPQLPVSSEPRSCRAQCTRIVRYPHGSLHTQRLR